MTCYIFFGRPRRVDTVKPPLKRRSQATDVPHAHTIDSAAAPIDRGVAPARPAHVIAPPAALLKGGRALAGRNGLATRLTVNLGTAAWRWAPHQTGRFSPYRSRHASRLR